jgi:hypothetical protein
VCDEDGDEAEENENGICEVEEHGVAAEVI